MEIQKVSINSIVCDPANVRRHSERNIEAVKASLLRFGQQTPLIVDHANVVRVGNCRLVAMQALGWTEVLIVRTDLTGAEAIAYAIADNRSGDPEVGSEFDHDALVSMLEGLKAEDESLVGAAGFTAEELVAYLESTKPDEPETPPGFPEFDETIETDHECPKCKYRWSGSTAPQGAAA